MVIPYTSVKYINIRDTVNLYFVSKLKKNKSGTFPERRNWWK